jgi:hypothetical protein
MDRRGDRDRARHPGRFRLGRQRQFVQLDRATIRSGHHRLSSDERAITLAEGRGYAVALRAARLIQHPLYYVAILGVVLKAAGGLRQTIK